ncbi:MAG: hypothetical protein FWF90_04415 [Promicromonosporaceae bacterium]|nr:hypothetical protein [Promicromonosporaceae bacterium]
MRTRTLTTALIAGALLLAGCSSPQPATTPSPTSPTETTGSSPSPTGTGSPAAESPASPVPTDLPAGPEFTAPGTPATGNPSDGAALTVTDIRVGHQDGFDRVVFDLGGKGTPGWRVWYVDAATDDGSGNPVAVQGNAILQVVISGTGIPADTGQKEFAGSPVDVSGGTVQQVVYRFVFEGYTTSFVGVDAQRPFRVFMLQNPTRLVVDVQKG